MKILVCGGRNYHDRDKVFSSLDACLKTWSNLSHLIHGAAQGADMLAGQWARANGVHEVRVYANWDKYGNSAGPIRNQRMLELAPNAVVAFPGGPGTAHMLRIARKAGIYVWLPCG